MDDGQMHDAAEMVAEDAAPAGALGATPRPPVPSLFPFVTGVLVVALLAILGFGALSLTGDIAELKVAADDNARAIADLRGDITRSFSSLAAPAKPAAGEATAAPGGERGR